MIAACRAGRVKLMIAYRLHFETLNISAMEMARRGQLGQLKFFTSSFSMTVRRGDIRTKRMYGGGTLYDIGVYCINAARNLFRAEPTQVSAVSINSGLRSLAEIDETTAATLRFGDDQLATFVTSFNASDVAAYRIVGTKGHLHADPAYEYAEGLEYKLTIDGNTRTKSVGKRDQFAPELAVLLRLHFERHPARTVWGRRAARRADRRSLVRVGAKATAGQDTALPEASPAHIAPTHLSTRREEATPRQSAKRES